MRCDFVLWDIDGTLIYNSPGGGALFAEALQLATGGPLDRRGPNPHGMTEGQLLAAALEVNGYDTALLPKSSSTWTGSPLEQHEAGSAPRRLQGRPEAIGAFADHGWTNALLTGNGPTRSKYKLLAAGYDDTSFDWSHSYFGHEAPSRHHLTAGARDALAGHHAVIIGDTPNDGEAADSAGIPFVAVATGIFDIWTLRRTSAILVVPDLASGLDDVVAAIESAVGE